MNFDVVIIGDSYVDYIYFVLFEVMDQFGKMFFLLGNNGCFLLLGVWFQKLECQKYMDVVFEIVVRLFVKIVVLVGCGFIYMFGKVFGEVEKVKDK